MNAITFALRKALKGQDYRKVFPSAISRQSYWWRCPTGKIMHPDPVEAHTAGRTIEVQGRGKNYVYFCPKCMSWHTTSWPWGVGRDKGARILTMKEEVTK